MADGHLLIGYDDWAAAAKKHLENGGALFPFEVAIDDAGKLVVTGMLGGGSTPLAGKPISSINGVDADEVTATLLARMHGDTAAFRRALLSNRWWFFYWKTYGAPERFDIVAGARRYASLEAMRSRSIWRANRCSTRPTALAGSPITRHCLPSTRSNGRTRRSSTRSPSKSSKR
jgi:hypothetical protein